MHYVTFWTKLQTVAGLEKLATNADLTIAERGQELLAAACDDIFTSVKNASGAVLPEMMTFRSAHRTTGEKIAASPEVAASLLQKLAVAEYVDNLLDSQLEKLSGDAYDEARAVQLLGREYAVHLMRGLLA